jgi:hypothetical protein
VTTLAPTYTHNGTSCSPASGSSQNFTSPVHYIVTAQDSTPADYTVTVTVDSAPISTYATWAAINAPGQTPSDDYDHDGVPNGVEYFMGQSGSSFTSNPGLDENHKIIWPKDTAFNGTWQVETSPDLINWTNVAATDLGTSVEYTLPGGMGTLFVRLVVTPN